MSYWDELASHCAVTFQTDSATLWCNYSSSPTAWPMSLGDHSFWQRGTKVLSSTALQPYSKLITQGEMLFTLLYTQVFCSWVFRCLSRINNNTFKQYYTLILLTALLHSELNTRAHGTSSRWGQVTNTSWHCPNSGLKASTNKMRWWFLLLMTCKDRLSPYIKCYNVLNRKLQASGYETSWILRRQDWACQNMKVRQRDWGKIRFMIKSLEVWEFLKSDGYKYFGDANINYYGAELR